MYVVDRELCPRGICCLHYAQVGTVVQQIGRKGMAKRVQRFASPTLTCTRACLETS